MASAIETRPNAVHRPPAGDLLLMGVAVVAVSTSGPLIAAMVVPALAIAFWRTALGATVIAPFALARHRGELRGLRRREVRLALVAGALLAAHFATWITSIRYTSVASSTALVAAQPVWTAMLARVSGHHVARRAWIGIAVALAGVVVLTGVDVSLSARALTGDALALVGGVFAAAYVVVGGEVRRTVSTTSYTLICYTTCAVVMLVVCLVGGQSLGGYSGHDWLLLLGLTGGAQLLGHSVFNRVLRTTSATVVSLSILFEVPGAALIAGLWLGQSVPWEAVPALALLLAGLVLVVSSRDHAASDEDEGVAATAPPPVIGVPVD